MMETQASSPRDTARAATPVVELGVCHRIPLFAESLVRSLAASERFTCRLFDVAEVHAGNGAAATDPPGLLLLDALIATGEEGLLPHVRRQFPACRVLLLVPDTALERLAGLAHCGSQGCVRESGTLAELCLAIQQVLTGKCFFAQELANALFEQLNGHAQSPPWSPFVDESDLTPREREVLRLIAREDLGNKQIARRLHVSLYTVKNHVHNIIEKMGVRDRHDAARQALRRNFFGAT